MVKYFIVVPKIDFGAKNSITVSPNPAKDMAKLSFGASNAGMAQISLIDYSGRYVMTNKAAVVKGINTVNLEGVGRLQSGVYNIKILLSNEVLQTSLIVVK